jgi:hypothetical protein
MITNGPLRISCGPTLEIDFLITNETTIKGQINPAIVVHYTIPTWLKATVVVVNIMIKMIVQNMFTGTLEIAPKRI